MRRFLFVMVGLLAMVGCKQGKVQGDGNGALVGDSAASAVSSETALPRTLAEAPMPRGEITTWLLAGMLSDGGYRMFIVEGDESRLVEDHLSEGTTIIYTLRLVSYEKTEDSEEALEEGGREESWGGPLVVDAYDPETGAFVARYRGEYAGHAEYDSEDEFVYGGESYSGTCTHADGTTEEFNFYGD